MNGQLIISGSIFGLPRMSMPMKHGLHVHEHTIMEDLDEASSKFICKILARCKCFLLENSCVLRVHFFWRTF